MNRAKINILLKLALVFAFATIIAVILQYKILPNKTRWYFLVVPFLSFISNYFAFLSAIGRNSLRNFSTQISVLFGIKFFSYLLFSLFFFILEKDVYQRLVFIAFIFVLYLLNTIVLLKGVLDYQKSILKSHDISK